MEPTTLLTLEDFIDRYINDGPFEIIEGQFFPLTRQTFIKIDFTTALFHKLTEFVTAHLLGTVYTGYPFVTLDSANRVKRSCFPDIMFFSAAHLKAVVEHDPKWLFMPLISAPDLAIEVGSPSYRMNYINQKLPGYLEDGVQLVWVIEPEEKAVTIYRPHTKQFTRLTHEDTLTGGDILPNFALPLEQLFE